MKKEDLIQKWLSGELSQAELLQFKQLEDYDDLIKIDNTSKLFNKELGLSSKALLENLPEKSATTQKSKVFTLNTWIKVAAVLVLALTTTFFLIKDTPTQYQTAQGQKLTVTLPDDSQVLLNAATSVSFQDKNWDKNRLITLDGEAFFKVTKGNSFTVKTNQGTVTVLGTQFNVFQRNDYFEVICYEGAVRVNVNETETATLTKGDAYRFSKANGGAKFKTTAPTASWLQGFSKFEETPVAQVLQDLERQFGIQITCNNQSILNKRFTGVIMHNNQAVAVETLAKALGVPYEVKGNQVILN